MKFKRTTKDGQTEILEPHLYEDGFYKVLIKVSDPSEVERLIDEGASVRMKSDLTNQVNLIDPKNIK